MAEQVNPDHFSSGITQQFGETGVVPGRVERAAPSMHENDRRCHGANRIRLWSLRLACGSPSLERSVVAS
jgi:hypothetical protein